MNGIDILDSFIRDFEENVPDRCPRMDETDREIWFYAGQRFMVQLLRSKLEDFKESQFGGASTAPLNQRE